MVFHVSIRCNNCKVKEALKKDEVITKCKQCKSSYINIYDNGENAMNIDPVKKEVNKVKDNIKEDYANQVIDFVEKLDPKLNNKERRKVISFAYKTFNNKHFSKTKTVKKQVTKKKK